MEKLTGPQQENTPVHNRVYYHGISGRRLEEFLNTGIIPAAQQAFGGEFSITDDYELAKIHAGEGGVVLNIVVDPHTSFGSENPFEDDYFPSGEICDIGDSEFIVNEPSKLISINIMKENVNEEKLKGGKADGMTPEDVAKKHGVALTSIEKEIKLGFTIESEHTDSKEKQLEVVLDHLFEDPEYYSNKKTGLISKEKQAEKRLEKQAKEPMNEIAKKMKALAGIAESDKKFLNNPDFDEQNKVENGDTMPSKLIENDNKRFVIIEFEQEEVEPGDDDDKLYKLK